MPANRTIVAQRRGLSGRGERDGERFMALDPVGRPGPAVPSRNHLVEFLCVESARLDNKCTKKLAVAASAARLMAGP